MRYKNSLLNKFGLQDDSMLKKRVNTETAPVNHLASPSYLRQSSNLIKEALQSGFDVLQLANGDIVTTGTKTIVNKYEWNATKNKLVKVKAANRNEARETKPIGKTKIRPEEKVTEDA